MNDENIISDIQFTHVLDENEIFINNAKLLGGENDLLNQYFATVNGVYRTWPARETSKNGDGTYKSEDYRYQPWLVVFLSRVPSFTCGGCAKSAQVITKKTRIYIS